MHDASADGRCSRPSCSRSASARSPATHDEAGADEVLYVLDGAGELTIGGETHELGPGRAIFVARGTVVVGRAASARASRCSCTTPTRRPAHAVVDLNAVENGTATGGRQFLLGATPERRLRVGDAVHRARPARPRAGPLPHLRRGDLRARGRGRARDRRRARRRFGPGSCVHLPARLVHCLANTGDVRAAAARRLPPGGLAGRGLLPRRHARRRPQRRATCRESSAVRRSSGKGTSPAAAGRSPATRGAFTGLPFTLATRIGDPEGKTSPEELLAAAHGGCLTMSLASELARGGHAAWADGVDCLIVMDEVPGEGHQIVGSQVTLRATAKAPTGARSLPRSSVPTRLPVLDAPAQGGRRGDDQPRLTSGRQCAARRRDADRSAVLSGGSCANFDGAAAAPDGTRRRTRRRSSGGVPAQALSCAGPYRLEALRRNRPANHVADDDQRRPRQLAAESGDRAERADSKLVVRQRQPRRDRRALRCRASRPDQAGSDLLEPV